MDKPMRIFADCHVFDGTLQGSTTYLKGLYTELIKNRSQHFFLAAHDTDHLAAIFGTHANVTYLKYRYRNKFLRLLLDIPLIVRTHQIDYAHFQYVVPPVKKCKYIITTHDVLFLDFPQYFPLSYRLKNGFLFKLSARFSDVALTVSDYSKARIAHHFGIENISVTPNAVDPAFFETFDKEAVRTQIKTRRGFDKYWLFVSRWEPRKNHDRLLRSFVEGQFYEDYHLVLIGDPALPNPAFEAYYEKLDAHIKQKILRLTKVGFDALLEWVRGASLSVYPSIAEGFGIPPLESLAAGVPTICSNATAMSDFDFLGDLLFDPLDVDDLTAKARLALQRQDVSDLREIVRQKFQWSVAAARFNDALSQ